MDVDLDLDNLMNCALAELQEIVSVHLFFSMSVQCNSCSKIAYDCVY